MNNDPNLTPEGLAEAQDMLTNLVMTVFRDAVFEPDNPGTVHIEFRVAFTLGDDDTQSTDWMKFVVPESFIATGGTLEDYVRFVTGGLITEADDEDIAHQFKDKISTLLVNDPELMILNDGLPTEAIVGLFAKMVVDITTDVLQRTQNMFLERHMESQVEDVFKDINTDNLD